MNFCHVWLTCSDEAEASKIADALLDKHLIACAKQMSVRSQYWYEGKKNTDPEVLIVMETTTEKFNEIEQMVAGMHSYDTFVLQAIPVVKASKKATTWWKEQVQ